MTNGSKNIEEVFPCKIPSALKNASVAHLTVNLDRRDMCVRLVLPQIIPYAEIVRFKTTLTFYYRLQSCDLSVHYENSGLDEQLLSEYRPNLLSHISEDEPILHFLFSDSEWKSDGAEITVTLHNGGMSLVSFPQLTSRMEGLFQSELGIGVRIHISEGELRNEVLVLTDVPVNAPPTPKPVKKSASGPAIYGNSFTGAPISTKDVASDSGTVILEGEVFRPDARETKKGGMIVTFNLTDRKSSVSCKIFLRNKDDYSPLKAALKDGAYVRLRGTAEYDRYEQDNVIRVRDILPASHTEREDTADEKRVEMHLHTQFSSMDGVSSPMSLILQAAAWGHSAIGVTDHGVVQAFPDAYKAQQAAAKAGHEIKILYGVEAYLYDNDLDDEIVVFDIETTGLNPSQDSIIEIGAVRVAQGEIIDRFSSFVHPHAAISPRITELTGITDEMVKDAPDIEEVLPAFLEFVGDDPVLAHNASFDVGFIRAAAERQGVKFRNLVLDTLAISRYLYPDERVHKLDAVAGRLGINNPNHHRAVNDAEVAAEIWFAFVPMLRSREFVDIQGVIDLVPGRIEEKLGRSYHTIIYAKNLNGLFYLYKIISASHLSYYKRFPRVPKKLLARYREDILVGSACEAGELFRAILNHCPEEKIEQIAKLYDYFEIQPLGNNEFLIRDPKTAHITSKKDLEELNLAIVRLGEKLHKPVVATCDVHFLNPEDEVYRRILMHGKGFDDADQQAPLYLRTTDEMLREFYYLTPEKAKEVVITNPTRLAELFETYSPVKDGTYPPSIENSAEDLQRLCEEKAHRLYGTPLPAVIEERMNKELKPIIRQGYDVMYMTAQKLVQDSNEHGYLVGSRGSVGSSFAAFLSGITEVNSLPAHYVCPECKYLEFPKVSPGQSGCDMEDKVCPECGHPLNKEGHDIPFETFLGFNADKAPDIDLNFSGEYQAEAHKYTEFLFGKGYTFKAGTIGTIAEKTAFGFVKKYCEDHSLILPKAEMDRLARGCTGVKRTTGQHPGGIIVLPKGRDIHEFTPVQHPADDMKSDIITTHFDYHSIHDNLLKLDILGHDDPTMIRMLENITGLDATTIPLDDKETMSLFTGTEALGVKPEDIDSPVGSYAVPEFGTHFVRQMLVDTKPTKFSELVRISGLSHGTDVWTGNAQDLIRSGTCTLSECICTRDDIMAYLISKEMEPGLSFKIMESVRKGKGLTPEWEEAMKAHDVPDWYITSCKKIKYMFPKAHAVAYVTMGFRVAYFKVHYPMAFYRAYYTVRADEFNYLTMGKGLDVAKAALEELKGIGKLNQKQQSTQTILEVVIEMYARGYDFLPIDLYESDAKDFLEKDGKLLPPFNSLPGLGLSAAQSIVDARKDGEFSSVEDLRIRAKISTAVIDLLSANGCLNGLPDSDQLDMFG